MIVRRLESAPRRLLGLENVTVTVPIGKYTFQRLEKHPAGLEALRACAVTADDKCLAFDTTTPCFAELFKRRRLPPPSPDQLFFSAFRDKHDLAAGIPVEALTAEERVGLGDLVEAGAKLVGADKLAAWYQKTTGLPCGCSWRKALLNRLRLWQKTK